MRRVFPALATLLGLAVSTASADYVVIVANLGNGAAAPQPPPGAPLGPGALPGAAPGALRAAPGPNAGQPPAPGAVFNPPPSPAFDPDTVPLMIIAVIEVEKNLTKLDTAYLERGMPVGGRAPSRVPFKVGGFDGKIYLSNTSIAHVSVLHPEGKPLPPLSAVYATKLKVVTDNRASTAEQWTELAEWSLAHGMLEQFKLHMDKALTLDKAYPKAVAYAAMKATLAKPVDPTDTAGPWRKQLLSTRYQTTRTLHYALLQNDAPAADARAKRLEDAFQSYYYWFALQGVQLPVPTQRLVAVLTSDVKEYKHLHTVLEGTPVVSDSFYARHENIAVFSSKRLDDGYDRLEKMFATLRQQGFNREQLLQGKGFPKQLAVTNRPEVFEAMTEALLLKVLEMDGEVSGTSHGATRQLLYASGFLPSPVEAPEWVQFGVSTFFETSPGSPWPTLGLPSFEYGPLYRDLISAKKLPPDPVDLLREVVTDGFFRSPPFGMKKEAALRRARATAWSLSHFLLRKRLDGLQRYFKELSNAPRDLPLDEQALWLAFARAFNAVDATGQPDLNVLRDLADAWDKDMHLEQYDNREINLMRAIRLVYKDAATRQGGQNPANPAGGPPGAPGAPPGAPGSPRRAGAGF